MYRITLIFFFFSLTETVFCQPELQLPYEGKGKPLSAVVSITNDKGYSITNLTENPDVVFRAAPGQVSSGQNYWLKISVDNPSRLSKDFVVRIIPQFNNTLYYFDPDQIRWITSQTDAANNDRSRLLGRHRLSFPAQSTSFFFVKLDFSKLGSGDKQMKLDVSFQPADLAAAHEHTVRLAWVCCVIVLLVFIFNNIYIYWSFRDKAVLYYLLAQLGGMIYITSYRWIFNELLPVHIFNVGVHDMITFYDVPRILMHLSILLVLCAITAFTREFLNTKTYLPKTDHLLRTCARAYGVFTLIAILINIAGISIEYYTLAFDNLVCSLLIILIMWAASAGYAKKIPFAATFILANGLPFMFILAIPISHLVVALPNEENLWFPELAIITQAFAFSIALVDRTRGMQSALVIARISNQQLEFDLKEAGFQVQLNQLEIDKAIADINTEKVKNDLLQQTLQTNQRELAASALHMVQKNELLSHLKSKLQLLSRPNPSTSQGMRAMSTLIDNSTQLDSDWDKFKIHFEQVHPHFFAELKSRYPALTTRETRLYAYFHMKLSHKEIAALLNIDPASVRRAKTRLFKKMALPETNQE